MATASSLGFWRRRIGAAEPPGFCITADYKGFKVACFHAHAEVRILRYLAQYSLHLQTDHLDPLLRYKLLQRRCSGELRMRVGQGLVRAILCASLLGCVSGPARGQKVKVWVSSNGGDRLTAKQDLEFGSAANNGANTGGAKATFHVDVSEKHQRIDGFGASIMEAGLMTLNTLPAEKQEEVLRALFDPRAGAGYTAMKTPLAGTDFQSAGPWFTYDDTPGDVELKNFSVERDFGPNGVGTYILRARKYGSFALQAPMDYPPDWMLYDAKK